MMALLYDWNSGASESISLLLWQHSNQIQLSLYVIEITLGNRHPGRSPRATRLSVTRDLKNHGQSKERFCLEDEFVITESGSELLTAGMS